MDRETLNSILDAIADGVIACDTSGRFTVFNAAAERLLGAGPSDCPPSGWPLLYGLHLGDGVTPFPAEELPLARALRGESCDDVELCVRSPRVPGAWLLASARPLRDASGALSGGVTVLRDAGARRRDADELRRVNTFLDSIVENVPAMIFVKEARELRFELINRASEELLGWSRRELLGKSDFDFFPREQAEFFQSRDRQALASGSAIEVAEEPIRTRHGERWLYTKKIPIRDASGERRYLLGISLDITARKQAEDELLGARADLRAPRRRAHRRALARQRRAPSRDRRAQAGRAAPAEE